MPTDPKSQLVSDSDPIQVTNEKGLASETLSNPQEPPLRFGGWPSVVLSLAILYALIGSFAYPIWWYEFFFEGGAFDLEYWTEGFGYLGSHFLAPFLLVLALLFVIFRLLSTTERAKAVNRWAKVKTLMNTRTGVSVHVVLVSALGASLWIGGVKAYKQKVGFAEFLAAETLASRRNSEATLEPNPLAEPTSFIFLSKENIDSLYGQYEPDLIPSSVMEEVKSSREFKGQVGVEEFLKTESGKSDLQKRLTEYRQSPQSTERKTRDLLRYLLEKGAVKRYRNILNTSEEIKKLDESIEFLKSNYNLTVDSKQLTNVRDRLLRNEILRLIEELKALHGLILVEGDWLIDIQADAYLLRRPFFDNVTDPPVCEARIRKTDISPQNNDILESLKGQRMRLSLFGNVITGMSGDSKTVKVNSFALF